MDAERNESDNVINGQVLDSTSKEEPKVITPEERRLKKKGRYKTQGKARVLARRKQIATLYLQGLSQWEISKHVNVGQTQVCKDLTAIRNEWLAEILTDFDAKQAEELAKIDQLEEIAWKAWHRSCDDAEVKLKRQEFIRQNIKGKDGKPAGHKLIPVKIVHDKKSTGQSGDPRFLDRIAWCIETRLRLMGLLKANGANVNVGNVNINWNDLHGKPEEANPVTNKLLEALKEVGASAESLDNLEDNAEDQQEYYEQEIKGRKG
jgi:hypothetical protein